MAQKILVIQTAFLGDLLLSIPLLKNTKRLYPHAEIHLLCRKGFGDFFKKLGLVNVATEIDKADRISVVESIKTIQKHEYELVLCPHQSVRSALIAKSLKSKSRIGFTKWWNRFIFDQRVKRRTDLPDALRQLSLLSPLDVKINTFFITPNLESLYLRANVEIPEWTSMAIHLEVEPNLRNKWGLKENVVFFAPGSVWNTKRWIKEKYVELGIKLQSEGAQIVVVGSPEEKPYAQEIADKIPNAKNIAGEPSLFELVQIFKLGKALVTNDNGAMHLGSVAGIPTVAIFGPTTLELGYRPWNNQANVVEDKNLACRPCGAHGHDVCPIGTHICMKNVSVDDVKDALKNL